MVWPGLSGNLDSLARRCGRMGRSTPQSGGVSNLDRFVPKLSPQVRTAPTVLLIRPDGYLALISDAGDVSAVSHYLDAVG
ncbi:hypothetical protein AB0A95_21400 [Micromonospora sp. NPDC049230]|uniref:hypothetical protein n=1 Tax=Micromonospora sp. NPDC049230 TaxID=3155502 RepID=UPI00340AD856